MKCSLFVSMADIL